jgi:hypothetical protein
VLFVRAEHDVAQSHAIGEAMTSDLKRTLGKTAQAVYWKFPGAVPSGRAAGA